MTLCRVNILDLIGFMVILTNFAYPFNLFMTVEQSFYEKLC